MNIHDKIKEAHARSANLYLRRQSLELERQHLNNQIQQAEMQMLRLDGEVEALERILREEQEAHKASSEIH